MTNPQARERTAGAPVARDPAGDDPIFQPLAFRNLTVKNRILRGNIYGRIDTYNGSGTQARVNWEETFARGGVGAIISAHVPIHVRGRILPNYAHIDDDKRIPFWREVGERVHAHDCKFILQLSHGGRQQDIAGVENDDLPALSSTDKPDSFHGFPCRAMTKAEIKMVVEQFAAGARRARAAGLDGVELHACNGYLITQFLSSGINDRTDEYGGDLENRARFLIEIIRAIRREVGRDFHLQVKINGADRNDALFPWDKAGSGVNEYANVCRWVEHEGADALHISKGSFFPHPLNPPGDFPIEGAVDIYDTMLSSGQHTLRNYLLFRLPVTNRASQLLWSRSLPKDFAGLNVDEAAAIKRNVSIPVICTGGFQSAAHIRKVLSNELSDAVSISRPFLANFDLVRAWEQGKDAPDIPCTYCNRCLFNVVEHPLGCYDVRRYGGDHDAMIRHVMSFFAPDGFGNEAAADQTE